MGHIAKRDGWLSTHRSRFTDEFYFDAQLVEMLLGRDDHVCWQPNFETGNLWRKGSITVGCKCKIGRLEDDSGILQYSIIAA